MLQGVLKNHYRSCIYAEYLFGHSFLLQSSNEIFCHLLYLYQSFAQLSLCWACDWRGWQPGLYLALHKSASFHALIAVVTGNHLWVITNDAEFFFTVNSGIVVSPSGILREPNWRSMGQDFFQFCLIAVLVKTLRKSRGRKKDDKEVPCDLIPWMNSYIESEIAFEDPPLNKAITHLIFKLQSRILVVSILSWNHVQRSASF